MNPIRRHVPGRSLLIALLLLAGCAAAQPPAAAPAPSANLAPSAAPAASTFEGLASGLDNTTQARIRATNAVVGTSTVDVYINGLPAFNGDKAQQKMDTGAFSGWLYVTPGAYTVALVPHGGALAQALFAPITLNAAAGHRYTVAAVGQVKAKDVKSLVIDETALETGIGAKPTDDVLIDINNVSGIAGIDEQLAGKPAAANILYGTAQAYGCPIGRPHAITSVAGTPKKILGQGDNTCEPARSMILSDYGPFPGDGNASQGTSELNMLDFLAQFNRYQVATDDGHVLTFNLLLAAIDKAGMRDQFLSGKPYFFFAPTDEAFRALPQTQRDTLLNDPQALATLLKAHIIDGYYPFGSLFSASPEPHLTNLLGVSFTMTQSDPGDIVHGVSVMGINYTVGNGNRVQFIQKLLPVK